MSAKAQDAVIFANINLNGRQIDIVVALDRLTQVIEAKGFARPVRGGVNGPWQVHTAAGIWKNVGNPYIQVLGAKNALRDAMRRFSKTEPPYPSAAVVFTPTIPTGSSCTEGDFKAAITGLDRIDNLLVASTGEHWSLDRWREFASSQRLTRVGRVDAAFSPEIAVAEELIRTYVGAFRRTYGPLADELLPYTCRNQEGSCTSTQVVERGARGDSFLLRGPSGCGKSLAAYRIGIRLN